MDPIMVHYFEEVEWLSGTVKGFSEGKTVGNKDGKFDGGEEGVRLGRIEGKNNGPPHGFELGVLDGI